MIIIGSDTIMIGLLSVVLSTPPRGVAWRAAWSQTLQKNVFVLPLFVLIFGVKGLAKLFDLEGGSVFSKA